MHRADFNQAHLALQVNTLTHHSVGASVGEFQPFFPSSALFKEKTLFIIYFNSVFSPQPDLILKNLHNNSELPLRHWKHPPSSLADRLCFYEIIIISLVTGVKEPFGLAVQGNVLTDDCKAAA